MLKSWPFYAVAAVILGTLALPIAGCSDGSDNETPSDQVSHVNVNEAASASEAQTPNGAEHTGETAPTEQADLSNQETGSSGADAHGGYNPHAETPTPLRVKIFDSYAIVRATLISSAAEAERYSAKFGGPGEFHWGRWIPSLRDRELRIPRFPGESLPVDGEYRAVHTFRFRVIEYLKGAGASEITVSTRTSGTRGTEVEALQVATDSLAERDTSRDTHEAILFLGERYRDGTDEAAAGSSQPEDAFQFLLSGPYPPLQYTIDTLNRVWLPAKDPPAPEETGSSSDDSALLFLTGNSSETVPPTISLGELRPEIAAVDTLIGTGGGTEEYKRCIVEGWLIEHRLAVLTALGTFGPSAFTVRLVSGAPEGRAVLSFPNGGPGYDRILIEGMDKDLFKQLLIDDDDRSDNGYTVDDATARPLPAGTYQYRSSIQPYYLVPCNFIADSHTIVNVVVTAPAGTLHELFFDPVTVGSTVAADGTNGVLKPAAFTDANGTHATIHRLAYDSSGVTITLIPHTAITGHTLDFIALDGSISLSLNVDKATADPANNTLTWPVLEQPWHPGDKLMLRISLANP